MGNVLPIARPPWTLLGKRLESMLRKALYDYKLLNGVSKLAVALSGGKDSLTLLYLLKAIQGRGFQNFDIYAIHVSGDNSCGAGIADNYLEAICKELGVKFINREMPFLDKLECYSCSRERRKMIFEEARNLGIDTIAFGHHRDDSNQTLLLNMLHKGEFAGNLPLVNMRRYGVKIIRPLIYIAESDIRNFAVKYDFARQTCCCTVGQNSMRKKVDKLIDDMEELFPNVRENLALATRRYGSNKADTIIGSDYEKGCFR